LDSSLTNFDLDSLIAIELRNWIARDFEAAMQTSEVLDSASIISLVESVAARSVLVASKSTGATAHVATEPNGKVHSDEGPEDKGSSNTTVSKPTAIQKLPPLPLPELESTLQLYMGSVAAFCSEEELEQTSKAIKYFLEPGGLGRLLHDRLLERVNNPEIDNWVAELYNASNFLDRRVTLEPFDVFFGSHLLSDMQHSQAERAAIIAASAFEFKQMWEEGKIEQDWMNEQPLCMESYHWLFNTTREPRQGSDVMQKFPGNNYLVALSNGHVFKVILKHDNEINSLADLQNTFADILDRSNEAVPSLGTMSADERNSWAQV
jgi:hypothetical protein